MEFKPRNIFSWDYDFFEGTQHLASLDGAVLTEAGRLLIGSGEFECRRQGFASGDFELIAEGERYVSATKPSAFRRRFEIHFGDRHLVLEAASAMGRKFELLESGRVIGSVRPKALLSRRGRADLPDDLPVAIRLFVVWLVILMWKRAAAAASG
jgi:hypothetical protein